MQVTTFLVTVFAGLCLATPVAQDHSSTSIFGLNDNCHPFVSNTIFGYFWTYMMFSNILQSHAEDFVAAYLSMRRKSAFTAIPTLVANLRQTNITTHEPDIVYTPLVWAGDTRGECRDRVVYLRL